MNELTDEKSVLFCNQYLSTLGFDRCFNLDVICQQGVKGDYNRVPQMLSVTDN